MKLTEAPEGGSRWTEINPSFASANPRDHIIRVMGCVDGWIVARRTGCAPFLCTVRDWHKVFRRLGLSTLEASRRAK